MNLKGLKLHKTVKHATELIEKPLPKLDQNDQRHAIECRCEGSQFISLKHFHQVRFPHALRESGRERQRGKER